MRFILLPISWIYATVVSIRNVFFDLKLFSSKNIEHGIGVGNLSMGGTGKSPLCVYIAELVIRHQGSPALLSRGYGRQTRGFRAVNENSLSQNVGDEPLMFKQRFGDKVEVYVCENRILGSDKIRAAHPNSTIIFDDIFQHRKIKTSLNILTTPFADPFYKDLVLPAGRLREPRKNAHRADCIVVTKCPKSLTDVEYVKIKNKLATFDVPIFFSHIKYSQMIPIGQQVHSIKNILLVTGIVDPSHLIDHLKDKYKIQSISFPDHHAYTEKNIEKIHEKFDTFDPKDSIILTTEKDKVRLAKFDVLIANKGAAWYYQPIGISMQDEVQFESLIKKHVRKV